MAFSVFSYGSFANRHLLKHEELEKMTDPLATSASAGTSAVKKIGTLQLAVIVFYTVSGGPIGIEETVRAGGAFYTLLGFFIFPIIWSIPEALVTAELGSAYPEASGTVAWVEEAYGPFWGWIQGFLTWTSGATDNAIYPVLFLDYAVQAFHPEGELDPLTRFLMLSTTALVLTYISYRGLDLVGDMSLMVCALSMTPFLVFCVVGMFKVDPSRWLQTPDLTMSATDDKTGPGLFAAAAGVGGIMWRPFLNNLFWNLNSFDSASCFAGEVTEPGRSFPRAMFGAVVMVMAGYLLPLLVALGASTASQDQWVDGFMATVVSDTVGHWLGAWVVFGVCISNLGMFLSEMSSDAYQILGLAERGYLPKLFAKRSAYGTPTYGLIVGCCVILAMSVTDLTTLVEMLNFNYAVSLLLEYAAFVHLRISKPTLERPYRIPLGTCGCILMLIPPVVMTFVIMMLASYVTYAYAALTIVVALVIYRLRRVQVAMTYDAVEIEDVEAAEEELPPMS